MNEQMPPIDEGLAEPLTGVEQLQQAAVGAKDMLNYLHDATRASGMNLEMRTPRDERGRALFGTVDPYYMNSGDQIRVYKVQVGELQNGELQHETGGRLWLIPTIQDEFHVKFVFGKDQPVPDKGQALAAEFLQAASAAFSEQQQEMPRPERQERRRLRKALGRIMSRAA